VEEFFTGGNNGTQVAAAAAASINFRGIVFHGGEIFLEIYGTPVLHCCADAQ